MKVTQSRKTEYYISARFAWTWFFVTEEALYNNKDIAE